MLAGYGISGTIGHTQPRRIAARGVATRIAQQMKSSVGKEVGFKIRFDDKTSADSYVKLMTDGILLAETQTDRFLDQYELIIVDEAHERSLNIDFLLGYLKRILAKRKNFRLVITSATIDTDRFAAHFTTDPDNPVPVINVEGRTYPVETRYQPPERLADGTTAVPANRSGYSPSNRQTQCRSTAWPHHRSPTTLRSAFDRQTKPDLPTG